MKRTILLSVLALAASSAFAQPAETTAQQFPAATAPGAGVGAVWRQPTALLYSNGALQTAATGGGAAGNEPVSALTAPDTSLGAGCLGTATGFRLSDNFVVPAGGWTINKLTVFGYQTQAAPGGSTVSTLTGGTLRIWNGAPNVAGSTVVFGDLTTNRVTATAFSTVWRAGSTTLTNVQRAAMAADFGNLSVTLTPGTYFIDYGLTGSTASGPFCPPNNVVSAANNALQLNVATATWTALTDGGSMRPLDLPFVLDGVVGGGGVAPTLGALPAAVTLTGGTGTAAVTVATAGVATASVALACTIPAGTAAFAITAGANRTINAPATVGANAPAIGLSCTPQVAATTATLSCAQTATPAGAALPALTSTITCPSATPTAVTATTPVSGSTTTLASQPVGGGTSTQVLSFAATGAGTLNCAVTSGGPAYSVAPMAVTLSAAGPNTTTVTFTGTTAGTFAGTVVCTPAAPATGGPFTYNFLTTVAGPVIVQLAVPALGNISLMLLIAGFLAFGMVLVGRRQV